MSKENKVQNIVKAKAKFITRRNTLAGWEAKNPVLACGEFGVVKDSKDSAKRLKLGDGVTPWKELEWIGGNKGGDNTKVDQTYNPKSKNAQSGIAVAEAMQDFYYTKKTGNLLSEYGEILENTILSVDGTAFYLFENTAYRTFKIPVFIADYDKYYFAFHNLETNVIDSVWGRVAICDKNNKYIANTYSQGMIGEISIKADGYIYISVGSAALASQYVLQGGEKPTENIPLHLEYINKSLKTSLVKGKKVCILGDSITVGATFDNNNGTLTYRRLAEENRWWSYFKDRYEFGECVVDAQSGRSFIRDGSESERFTQRVKNIATDTDIIIVFGGINDFTQGLALGTVDDTPSDNNGAETTQTFNSAIKYCADYLTNNFQNATIVFMTPLQKQNDDSASINSGASYQNAQGKRQIDYINALKDVCRNYGIYCLDMSEKSNFRVASSDWVNTYMPDGLHPNEEGTKIYVNNCIIPFFDDLWLKDSW